MPHGRPRSSAGCRLDDTRMAGPRRIVVDGALEKDSRREAVRRRPPGVHRGLAVPLGPHGRLRPRILGATPRRRLSAAPAGVATAAPMLMLAGPRFQAGPRARSGESQHPGHSFSHVPRRGSHGRR